jgi:Tol biopolymer transport system component
LPLALPASLLAHVPQIPLAYRHIFGGGGGMYMESMYLPPVTTGPWSPSWSPDGKEIVFAMQGSVWKIAAFGGEAVQLTAGPHYDSSPDWSRDGKRIAFTRDTGKVIDIWTVGAGGGEPEKLTRSVAFSVNPRWSPDGAAILFDSLDNAERIGLWTVSASDGTVRPLLVDSFQNITGSFSPDGRDIVFVSDRQWDGRRIQGTGGIWRLRLGQNEPTILLPEETVWHARPAWSPDGRKVAYGSFRSGRIQLWVMSAGDTNPMQITYEDGEAFTPAWSPDSRKLAYISNAGGKFSLRVVAAVGGTPKDVTVSRRKYLHPVGRVEVSVKDAATGETTEARVYLKASDGKSYTPPGEFHRMVVVTDDHYFHTRGSFAIELPAGPASIEVMKGFEYGPESQTVNVVAGETQKVELTLSRTSDLASLGWYSGDNHIHMNYGGIFQATPRSLLLEADAEDLNVVNDLVANQAGTRIHDLAYFEGKLSSASKPNRLLYFNEEYRPSFAGHMSLLNVKKFVHPQFDGFAGTALAAHYPPNAHILDEVHAQGAVAGYVHPFQTPGRDPEDDDYRGAREFPVSAALGQVDYYDVMCIWSDERVSASVWYRVLNLGFRVPASAGTDAMTNYWRHPAIGTTRVYVKAGTPLDYGNWIRGLTEGRSFVTNGPLLFLKVDGQEPGAELRLPGGGDTSVRVEVEATSILPMETLDILVNGEVVSSTKATDPHRVELRASVPVKKSGWIAARVTGPERLHLLMDSYVYAHTSPIYLTKGNESPSSPADARYFLKWIDRVLVLLQESEAFDTKAQKEEVIEVWRKGREVYSVLAQE